MKNIRLVIFILVYFYAVPIFGQYEKFDLLDLNVGLSQKSVFCMTFDSKGYLWVGTLNGLNKYDGYQFQVFKPNNSEEGSISGSHCKELTKGDDGDVWVLTNNNGLDLYKASQNKFIHYNDSLFKPYNINRVSKIHYDEHKVLWLHYNNKILAFNTADSTLNEENIEDYNYGICEGYKGGVYCFGKMGIVHLNFNDSTIIEQKLFSSQVISMCFGNDSLYILQNKQIICANTQFTRIDTCVTAHHVNLQGAWYGQIPMAWGKGNLWVGSIIGPVKFTQTEDGYKATNFRFTQNNPNSFKGYGVTDICIDKSGNVMIGAGKHGLNFYSNQKNKFKHIYWDYSNTEQIAIDPVRAICHDKNGDLWLGFDTKGVGVIHSDGSQTHYSYMINKNNQKESLQFVRVILQDSIGNIWMGTDFGVCIYNQINHQIEAIDRHFPWNWNGRTYAIEIVDRNTVLISSKGTLGILNLADKSVEEYALVKGGTNLSSVRDIEVDGQNNIWLGLDGSGILYLNRKTRKIQQYNTSTAGLSDNKVYAIKYVDGYLWVGTNNGLNKFNLNTLKVEQSYFERDGLSDNIIYSINKDEDGYLWMSTNKGISRLNLENGSFNTFLNNHIFMDDASYKDDAGNIYLGGYSGVVAFQPSDLNMIGDDSKLFFEQFYLFDKEIFEGDDVDGTVLLNQDVNSLDELTLNYKQNTFSFKVNALPFDYPNINKFRYRLSPWVKDWQLIEGNNRKIQFTNVNPGNYLFEVQMYSSKGKWEKSRSLKVIIVPPFWQRLWFKIAVLVLLVVLVLVVIQIQIWRVNQRNKLLKQKVQEQTINLVKKNEELQTMSQKLHEADEAKLRFFTSISHEFRTPLSVITGYLDSLENENTHRIRTIIRNNANRLLRLVNELIEFRKIDLKQMGLHVSKIELESFIRESIQSFEVLAKQKQINLKMISSGKLFVWLDGDKLDKIVFNLISNAIKYSEEGKQIVVRITDEEATFNIQVIDEGVGIKKEEQEKVFERFYRSDSSSVNAEGGHGIGLSLVKEFTEMMSGSVSIESEVGRGATFTLTFKKGNSHFEKEIINIDNPVRLIPEVEEEINKVEKTQVSDTSVLVVEDNHDLRYYLKDLLTKDYVVHLAENGKKALHTLEDTHVDLIISDIMMPEMDGVTLCKKVKENISTCHIPIILLTAKSDNVTKLEGFSLGIDDYIEKPFDKELFLARVKALFNNRAVVKSQLTRLTTTDAIDKSKISKQDMQFWNKVNEHMMQQLSNPEFNMEVLSASLNMSRSTFYRKFKGLTGENAADYLRKQRLEKAAELIKEGRMTLSQISQEVGFSSVTQFRSKFKELFGVNPSEYK